MIFGTPSVYCIITYRNVPKLCRMHITYNVFMSCKIYQNIVLWIKCNNFYASHYRRI